MTESESNTVSTWLWPRKKKDPAPPPADEVARPGVVNYVKAWALFRQIPIDKLGSLAVLVPLIVFLAVSGFIAWAAVLLGLFLRVLWSVFRGFRRGN